MSESYYSTLDPPSRKRYNEKTELIENKDPYTLSENEFPVDISVFFIDILPRHRKLSCIQTKSIFCG